MSLTTRCPACDTVFKIVPDQLKVSNGWVRCGRCAEVFDAAAHAATSDEASPWPQASPAEAVISSVTSAPSPAIDVTAAKDAYSASKNIASQPTNTSALADFTPPKEPAKTDLSFVRVAKNKVFWQQRSVINSLRAVCIGLTGLLFFQVVFSERNHLAASSPALKTGFESLCQTMGCSIESFKNIDAFKIDNSSFQKSITAESASADTLKADVFDLKLAIKNSLDLPVAMPAVELTLTDAGDKPVLRRVLLAKDIGFIGSALAASGEWSGAISVAVTPNPSMAPITGYRVLLFYP